MYRVMLVDDEPTAVNLLKTIIKMKCSNYEVIATANHGQEALELMEQQVPDLLITDIHMPVMGGLQLLEKVKENYPDVLSIIVSGYQEFQYAQEAIRWMEDTIDDVVNAAYEWNDETIKLAEAQIVIAATPSDCEKEKEWLASLREDEKILDELFDRTRYGKELSELAEKLADEFIRDMASKEGIDGAIERMAEAVKAGKDLLPGVSPALKSNTGRTR